MAIALTGAAVVGTAIVRTTTPSYTVGAASNLLVASIESSVQPTGVTYGGASMTLASEKDTTDSIWTTLAYLLNPATGANNFAFTISAGAVTISAADYSGVDTTDGAAVTNFGSGSASLTTNVTLAGANEWVVASGFSGHSGGAFSNTTNLTVEASTTTPTTALMDTAGGVGSGTIGFVTTVSLTSPRQAVVMQAFTPSGAAPSADNPGAGGIFRITQPAWR